MSFVLLKLRFSNISCVEISFNYGIAGFDTEFVIVAPLSCIFGISTFFIMMFHIATETVFTNTITFVQTNKWIVNATPTNSRQCNMSIQLFIKGQFSIIWHDAAHFRLLYGRIHKMVLR